LKSGFGSTPKLNSLGPIVWNRRYRNSRALKSAGVGWNGKTVYSSFSCGEAINTWHRFNIRFGFRGIIIEGANRS
jgi:hypothetical protein